MLQMESFQSCDTFVVLPPLTKHGVVFGKNSDRPQGEIQEVIYVMASETSGPTKVSLLGFFHECSSNINMIRLG